MSAAATKKTSRGLDTPGIEIPDAPGTEAISGGLRAGSEGEVLRAELVTPRHRSPDAPGAVAPSSAAASGRGGRRARRGVWQEQTFEQAVQTLRRQLGQVSEHDWEDPDAPEPPREARKWLRESTDGMIERNELFEGASIVIICKQVGVVAGEITAIDGPGLKARQFRMHPWGCARELAIDTADVSSIRLAPRHTWAEKQAVGRVQKARLEGPPKDE